MRHVVAIVLGALALSTSSAYAWNLYPSTTPLENHPVRQLTGLDLDKCDNPCLLKKPLHGGIKEVADLAVVETMAADKDIVINDVCQSACLYWAMRVERYVWITRNALFEFHLECSYPFNLFVAHMVAGDVVWKTNPPPKPLECHEPELPWIFAQWVKKNGGYSDKGVRLMTGVQAIANHFWREWIPK